MSVILSSGMHRCRLVEKWARLPDGLELRDVGSVACDSKDNVYVFNRGEHGGGVESGKFMAPHGIGVDTYGDIYVGEVSSTGWAAILSGRSGAQRVAYAAEAGTSQIKLRDISGSVSKASE